MTNMFLSPRKNNDWYVRRLEYSRFYSTFFLFLAVEDGVELLFCIQNTNRQVNEIEKKNKQQFEFDVLQQIA